MDLSDIARGLREAADELEKRSTGEPRSPDPLGGAERAAIAEEIAGVARHDLRNRLGSIRNAAFYLERRTEPTALWSLDERVPRFFALIQEQIVGAMTLLDGGLRLGHLFGRRIELCTVRRCVDHAIACARAPAIFEVEDVGAAGAAEVEVDLREVAVGLRCLLENAAEATGPSARVHVTLVLDGTHVVVSVQDDGPGIAEERAEALFQPFHTTKDGHAGLGLAIARRVAQRHGGDVIVRPLPPSEATGHRASGARLTFTLPVVGAGA